MFFQHALQNTYEQKMTSLSRLCMFFIFLLRQIFLICSLHVLQLFTLKKKQLNKQKNPNQFVKPSFVGTLSTLQVTTETLF